MKYEKVILVTPENAEEQAQFEAEYPHLQFYSFRTLKTFVVPLEDESLVKGKVGGNGAGNNHHAAVSVLNDYYGIQVPDSFLRATFDKNPALQEEVAGGGINDPARREMLVNALLRELGQPSWPANDVDPRILKNFQINLSMKLTQIGGKLKYKRV